jgi:hypothetical protein
MLVRAKGIDTAELADGAVEALQLNTDAVEEGKIKAGAVTNTKIGASAVDDPKLNSAAISLAANIAQPDNLYIPALVATNLNPFWYQINSLAAPTAETVLTTKTLRVIPIYLRKGQIVTSIKVTGGTVAADTPLHWWFALYSPTKVLLGQTADQATAAWAGFSTSKTLALSSPYTILADGIYYIGICMQATVLISLLSFQFNISPVNNGDTSDTNLTTTAPNPFGTITPNQNVTLVEIY